MHMKNYYFSGKQFQSSDPIESYFECVTSCEMKDKSCISRCLEILKNNESLNF